MTNDQAKVQAMRDANWKPSATYWMEQATAAASVLAAKDAQIAAMREALEECRDELDAYSRQEYPLDHPVHERYRKRDFDANPARIALAALDGQGEE